MREYKANVIPRSYIPDSLPTPVRYGGLEYRALGFGL